MARQSLVNFRALEPFRRPIDGRPCMFRSAALQPGRNYEVGMALARHGIGTVVDLRTESERASAGGPVALGAEVATIQVPVRTRRASPSGPFPSAQDYAAYYVAILEDAAAAMAHAFVLVAQASLQGVVFGCAQGKDRTGLLAAAILEAIGAPRSTIAHDFALSGAALKEEAKLWESHWRRRGLDRKSYMRRYDLGEAPLQLLYDSLPSGSTPVLSALEAAAEPHVDLGGAVAILRRLANQTGGKET